MCLLRLFTQSYLPFMNKFSTQMEKEPRLRKVEGAMREENTPEVGQL